MTSLNIYAPDAVAFAWFVFCWAGYVLATNYTSWGKSGFVARMDEQRKHWMLEMAQREDRIVDAQLLAALASGNAFFASTCVFVIAGLMAMLGASGQVSEVFKSIPFLSSISVLEFELKVGLMVAIYIFAFFKFAWAYRLSLSTAILVGATPELTSKNKAKCLRQGARAGEMAVLLGKHTTAGLRAFYFGLSVLTWLFNPFIFMVAVAWVLAVLYRREYLSNALGTLRAI